MTVTICGPRGSVQGDHLLVSQLLWAPYTARGAVNINHLSLYVIVTSKTQHMHLSTRYCDWRTASAITSCVLSRELLGYRNYIHPHHHPSVAFIIINIFSGFIYPVYTMQPVVKPVVESVWQPAVYTIQPVVKPASQPVWQQVVWCKRGYSAPTTTRP